MNRSSSVEFKKFNPDEIINNYLALQSEYARKEVESEDALNAGLSDKYVKLQEEVSVLKQQMNEILEIDHSLADEVRKLNTGLNERKN